MLVSRLASHRFHFGNGGAGSGGEQVEECRPVHQLDTQRLRFSSGLSGELAVRHEDRLHAQPPGERPESASKIAVESAHQFGHHVGVDARVPAPDASAEGLNSLCGPVAIGSKGFRFIGDAGELRASPIFTVFPLRLSFETLE
jgi:hypothetical protein